MDLIDTKLTEFQQELMDAALRLHVMLYEVDEAIDIGDNIREALMRDELCKAETAFRALVARAVDLHHPIATVAIKFQEDLRAAAVEYGLACFRAGSMLNGSVKLADNKLFELIARACDTRALEMASYLNAVIEWAVQAEAKASKSLDKDPECHTCHNECTEFPQCPGNKENDR